MASKLELPTDTKLAGKLIEAEHASRIAEMGRVGVWLGSRDNAVVYIAAGIVVLSMIGAVILALPDSPSQLRSDIAKGLAALGLSALGYMFGSSGRRSGRAE